MAHWKDVLGVGPWWGYRNVILESHYLGQSNEVRMDVGFSFQNGVQIELIQQTNDTPSPYSDFLTSDKEQVFHQIAYFAPDIDKALKRARAAGMTETGMVKTPQQRFYYMEAPWLGGGCHRTYGSRRRIHCRLWHSRRLLGSWCPGRWRRSSGTGTWQRHQWHNHCRSRPFLPWWRHPATAGQWHPGYC